MRAFRRLLSAAAISMVAIGCVPAAIEPSPSATVASFPSEAPPNQPPPSSPPASARPLDPPRATPLPINDAVLQAMVDVIVAHRPQFRFQLAPDRLGGDWRLDGDADDGLGPGRLFVDVTSTPGTLTANPCADPDFTQGGECVQHALPGGDRLFLRGTVDFHGIKTVVVTLIHPDRSGVTAEAGNLSIIRQLALPAGKSIEPGRPAPLYTVTELAELVVAIDRRVRELRGR